MHRVVVLGTGTGVGKTYVARELARALRAAPSKPFVQALKPIETGVDPGAQHAQTMTDAALLDEVSSTAQPRPHPLYAFEPPISPHRAARLSGVDVRLDRIREWLERAADTALHGMSFQIVETAGGACSPVSATATNLDLARALEPATWVLVAPDSLGVLHDVRASLAACSLFARLPDFLVLSAARPSDASTGTNAEELPRVGLPAPLAVVQRGGRGLAPLVQALLTR